MEDHVSGKRVLSEKDRAAVEKKIEIFEKKLETMSAEMDDREIERLLQRERLIADRTRERLARRERRQKEMEDEL